MTPRPVSRHPRRLATAAAFALLATAASSPRRADAQDLTVGAANSPYAVSTDQTFTRVNIGVGDTGVFNQTGGTLTDSGALYLGLNASGNGTYNLSAGTLTVANNFLVSDSGTGVFNQSGGVVVARAITLGFSAGGNGTYNLGGNGSLTTTGNFSVGFKGNGAFNMGGTSQLTTQSVLITAINNNVTASFNLNGGTLTTGSIQTVGSRPTINFNGGTIVASANAGNFISSGSSMIYVGSGGITLDTAGFAIGISAFLSPSPGVSNGGLTKRGAGTLTLGSSVSYGGATTVAGGTLTVASDGYLNQTSLLSVSPGAVLTFASSNRVTFAPLTLGTPASAPSGPGAATFNTGGFSQSLSFLTLDGDGVIDLGAGASQLRFGTSAAQPWRGTLSIYNYSGNPIVGLGADELFFGTGPTGLTAAQLAQIRFYSDAGTTLLAPAGFASLTGGEVVPGGLFPVAIPEPSTWALLLAAGAGLLAVGRVPSRRQEAL